MALRVVEVESGLLAGVPGNNPAYTVYKGVPYAAPPVGELRWKKPALPVRWDGVRQADRFGPISIQAEQTRGTFYQKEFFPVSEKMSEDCLYLNIWTPAESQEDKLPVMMWIHGGAFMGGYGSEMEFDGEAFCKRGVILVTINYRLGLLGFLAHPELTSESGNNASGNYGLLDQIAALEWIRRNISSFGGDPGNVTIFGQSAGAMSVHALVASPLAKGLFHKAIMQSAGGVRAFGSAMGLEEAENIGEALMKEAGVHSISQLRQLDYRVLFDCGMKLMGSLKASRLIFAPIVDGCVLEDDPSDAIIKGMQPDIPYMMGSTMDEFTSMGKPAPVTIEQFVQNAERMYGDKAEEYIRLSGITSDEEAARQQSRMVADNFLAAHRAWADLNLEQKKKPVYLYYFDRVLPGEDSDYYGAFHSAELWYVFGTLMRSHRPFKGIDYELSQKMTSYWANFAKYGDPNGENLPVWTPYTVSEPFTMELGESIGMKKIGDSEKIEFLKKLFLGRL